MTASLRLAFWALALIAAAAQAMAQSPACDRIRAELASLPPAGGARQSGRQIQRYQGELDRLIAYARSIGCQNRRFLMFGREPPAQCGSLEAQIGRLESTVAALQGEDLRASAQGRRAQLMAAYDSQCRGQGARQQGFFEELFGGQVQEPAPPEETEPELEPEADAGFSGRFKTICVRKCDGFYYPMGTSVTQASFAGQEELCQAACPGAQAELFVQRPERDVAEATALDGTSYSALPNAFRYRQTYDATCSCRNQGQSWSQALAEAEKMLAGRNTDVTVTEEKSRELSRVPSADAPAQPRQKPAKKPASAATALDPTSAAAAASGATAPTAGQDVSGIGGAPSGAATVGVGQGETRHVTTPTGETKKIRVVAPTLAPRTPPQP